MTASTAITATPDLEIIDGQITTTSNQVAQHFNKRHDRVLRAIENLECSNEFRLRNFGETVVTRENPSGGAPIASKAYRLTRDGFTFLAMGFTGKEAAQWKEAYITAFNKMEAELLARTTRPANPAIDYTRISPAQAQGLKELVHSIVDAKVQGFAETWARLHKKFRVNSYLELPATRFEEARDYLLGKLPEAPQQEINVAALLLSGQCDPKPLTAAQHMLIDQCAGRLVGEAYPLIRAHLERRVAWNSNAAQQNSAEATQAILGGATLGNCLAHHYRNELQAAHTVMQVVRQRLDAALGSIIQPLGLSH